MKNYSNLLSLLICQLVSIQFQCITSKIHSEIYVLEEKDYPKSVYASYPGVGQVSGITALPSNDVAIFHRSSRQWDANTFDNDSKRVRGSGGGGGSGSGNSSLSEPENNLINSDTIMILSGDDGGAKASFGADLFYMPHGIASDSFGNIWVTDVGKHQVMRLPTASLLASQALSRATQMVREQVQPDIVVGESFVPGNDSTHFCQPSDIKISQNGELVYVADGYCNHRIVVLNGNGDYVGSIGDDNENDNDDDRKLGMGVVHSLALIERRNLICAADRDKARILCFRAGLDGKLDSLGELVTEILYPFGRVFAFVALGPNNLLISSQQFDTNRYDLATLNVVTREIRPVWVSSDLLEPHALAKTNDGNYVYAADISPDSYKKVFQFIVIRDEFNK